MRMIPPYIDRNCSNAESKLFELLKTCKMRGEFACLHSLGISRHVIKREGEIDFLLVSREGIFVIEVKGGRVDRKNGLWIFKDRFGRISEKAESPFVQAKTAMYSLRSELIQQFGENLKGTLFGYGVAFPDIDFSIKSPEWDRRIIFNLDDTTKPFSDYIYRLTTYWTERQKIKTYLDDTKFLAVINYLRGDFETVCSMVFDINSSEREIIKLTQEQYQCVDAMEENNRVMFAGTAGTGKTLLAVEKARRNNYRGIKTLYLCFNKFLAEYVKDVLALELDKTNIDIYSVHSYFQTIIGKNSLIMNELETARKHIPYADLYNIVYPELFIKSLQGFEQYTELIIDEAQDVITDNYIAAIDHIVKGGLSNGRWCVLIDPENQKDIFNKISGKWLSYLKNNSTAYKLTVNCRNTKKIVVQTEIVSGFKLAPVKTLDGPPVRYLWYENHYDQSIQVSDSINGLLSQGVKPEQIVILSTKRNSLSVAGSGALRLDISLKELSIERFFGKSGNAVLYTTAPSFKGLESPIVIFTDIENFDDNLSKTINYVGCTRARTVLVISANIRLKKRYKELVSSVLSRV